MSTTSNQKNSSSSWTKTSSQEWLESPPWMGSTHSRSLRAQREANYANRMMLLAEQDFNREMANYYAADNVASRYRQAGINPMLAMQNQSLGQAGSSSPTNSAAMANPSDTAMTDNLMNSVGGILNSVDSYFNNSLKAEESTSRRITNTFDTLSLLPRLSKVKSEAKREGHEAAISGIEEYIAEGSKEDKVIEQNLTNDVLREQANRYASAATLDVLEAQYKPTYYDAQTENLRASTAELLGRVLVHRSEVRWYDAMSYTESFRALKEYWQANNAMLDNRLFNKVFQARVRAEWASSIDAWNNRGANNDFESWYNTGYLMGGSERAGIITQSVIAGLHEIEDVAKTVGEVMSDLKGVGISDTKQNRDMVTDMVQVRKEQLTNFGSKTSSKTPLPKPRAFVRRGRK